MEFCLCEKPQYVGKSEYSLNLKINTHGNDVWRTDGPPCDKYFKMPGHNFNVHAKLISLNRLILSHSQNRKHSLVEHREGF